MAKVHCIGFTSAKGIVKVSRHNGRGLQTHSRRMPALVNESAKTGEPLGQALAELLGVDYNKQNGADELGKGI